MGLRISQKIVENYEGKVEIYRSESRNSSIIMFSMKMLMPQDLIEEEIKLTPEQIILNIEEERKTPPKQPQYRKNQHHMSFQSENTISKLIQEDKPEESSSSSSPKLDFRTNNKKDQKTSSESNRDHKNQKNKSKQMDNDTGKSRKYRIV